MVVVGGGDSGGGGVFCIKFDEFNQKSIVGSKGMLSLVVRDAGDFLTSLKR